MEHKKDLTKRLIAESFKELVIKQSFEKLTIKKISDQAGIIRPTFYNYYRDKFVTYIQGYMLQQTDNPKWPDNPALTPYTVASYETSAFISYIKFWVFTRQEATAEQITDAYIFMRNIQ